MPIKRGNIVLVRVPDTSGKPGKARPALVTSVDRINQRTPDMIVAPIMNRPRIL